MVGLQFFLFLLRLLQNYLFCSMRCKRCRVQCCCVMPQTNVVFTCSVTDGVPHKIQVTGVIRPTTCVKQMQPKVPRVLNTHTFNLLLLLHFIYWSLSSRNNCGHYKPELSMYYFCTVFEVIWFQIF